MFSWLKRFQPSSVAKSQARRFRPALEALEDRLVPALALTLTGDPNLIVMPIDTAGTYSVSPTNEGLTWNNNNFTGTGGFTSGYAFERAGNIIKNHTPGSAAQTITDISSGNLLGVSVTGDAFGPALTGLKFTRTFTFDKSSNEVIGTIQLTNTTASTTFQNVAYQDFSDSGSPGNDTNTTAVAQAFDANGKPHFVYSDVLSNGGNPVPLGLVMSMGSADPRAVASAALFSGPIIANPYNNINNPDLQQINQNTGVALAFAFGDILPGETVVGQYNILFATTPQDTLDQWFKVLPQGGCGITALAENVQNTFRPLRYVFEPSSQVFTPGAAPNTFAGNITITNISTLPIGPNFKNDLTVVFPKLPPGVTLANPTGITRSGKPYITVSGSDLTPDGTLRVPITLTDAQDLHLSTFYFQYPLQVWAGAFDATVIA